MFLAFLKEQEEKVRETRKNKNMKKQATRTWVKGHHEELFILELDGILFKMTRTYGSVLRRFNTHEYENLWENLWSKRIMTFSTTKYENVHGVR
jgi:hypothetical protein